MKHGGARSGAGRPEKQDKKVRTTINLTPKLERNLMEVFDGNNWSGFMRMILELGLNEYKAQNAKK